MSLAMQDRYAKKVIEKITRESIYLGLVNREFEGVVTVGGTVKIPDLSEITAGDYSRSAGGTMTSGELTYIDLPIEFDKYLNLLIDGWEAQAVPVDVQVTYMARIADAIRKAQDDSIRTKMLGGTVSAATTIVSASNVLSLIIDENKELNAVKVPGDRFIVVNSNTEAFLLQNDKFVANGDSKLATGKIGTILGCEVHRDASLANLATPVDFIIGSKKAVAFADAFTINPRIISADGTGIIIGGSLAQARSAYGVKLLLNTGVRIYETQTV